MRLELTRESWPLSVPFRITGSTMERADLIVATLEQDGHIGRGEAAGVDYRDEDVSTMNRQIEAVRPLIQSGITRDALRKVLPPGGARNAIDCALWDLEAKRRGMPAWQLAGLDEPRPILTTYTIGADPPDVMASKAKGFAEAKCLKLKLTGETTDTERVMAVRDARPEVWLGVDANQGFSRAHLDALMPVLTDEKVALIEQPFPIGEEPSLESLQSPIPIAADESAQDLDDLQRLRGRFNMINIKLDKCGGLTEALMIATAAKRQGFDLMVGNMVGTSLAMAPAFLVGQLCQVVDLDGPILLKADRANPASYAGGFIRCDERIWGARD